MKSFYKEVTFEDIDYSPEKMLEVLHSNKVTVLRGYGDEKDPFDFFTKFSDQLGEIVPSDEDLLTGQSTGKRWIDITYDPKVMNKYRSAPVGQPLHTDASYSPIKDNLQFFYCAGRAKLGGATTFIDAHTVVELLEMAEETELLEDLQKDFNMSIILITHDLGIVRKVADRVCVMTDGKIVEQGETEAVFTNPQHLYTQTLIAAAPKLPTLGMANSLNISMSAAVMVNLAYSGLRSTADS